jgi:acetyl esterase
MALDEATRVLIDAMTAWFPAVGTDVTDAAEARRIMADAPRPPFEPPAVARVEDRTITGGLPVRIYWPTTTKDLPIIVYFHGGGWVLCDLDTHDRACRQLALGADAVVVSVDYRLAPEHRFPAAADDALAAVQWAAASARSLGADPGRLAVAGDSAGGNLAAVAALRARDEGGPPIAFQLLIYPVIDAARDTASYKENATGYFLTVDHMQWYWEQYVGPDDDPFHPYASPIRGDLRGLPPGLVITAELDPLRDEGEAYAAALRDAGVAAEHRRYDGGFHGFFSLTDVLPVAQRALADAVAALRGALL